MLVQNQPFPGKYHFDMGSSCPRIYSLEFGEAYFQRNARRWLSLFLVNPPKCPMAKDVIQTEIVKDGWLLTRKTVIFVKQQIQGPITDLSGLKMVLIFYTRIEQKRWMPRAILSSNFSDSKARGEETGPFPLSGAN